MRALETCEELFSLFQFAFYLGKILSDDIFGIADYSGMKSSSETSALKTPSLEVPVSSGMKKTPSSMFRIGEDSDSDDSSVINTEDKCVQTEPIEEMNSLPAVKTDTTPRSLEECLTVFKSDVSCEYMVL